ncbi:MAG: DUF4349 domain-containing protein [Ferruginibacter sp.]
MKKVLFITSLLCFSIAISCSKTNNKDKVFNAPIAAVELFPVATKADLGTYDAEQQIPVEDQLEASTDSSPAAVKTKMPVDYEWDKKIIKTAFLKIEVPDFKKYNDIVYKTVKQLGGYVSQEEQNLSSEKNETVVTIKVPIYEFESMMNDLPGVDTKIIEKKINTDDVTAKVIDTRSRLEAKKEMRRKYMEFLKQSKNMKEVLEVQGEINSIQEEMEAATGQINYLSHQSAMSTINLTFYQLQPGYKPAAFTNPSFLTRVADAFKSGANWLAELFIGIMSVWPLSLIIIATILIFRKRSLSKMLPVLNDSSNKKK